LQLENLTRAAKASDCELPVKRVVAPPNVIATHIKRRESWSASGRSTKFYGNREKERHDRKGDRWAGKKTCEGGSEEERTLSGAQLKLLSRSNPSR
jgi:hypothetical protein